MEEDKPDTCRECRYLTWLQDGSGYCEILGLVKDAYHPSCLEGKLAGIIDENV